MMFSVISSGEGGRVRWIVLGAGNGYVQVLKVQVTGLSRVWSRWEGRGGRLEVQNLGEGTRRSDLCFGRIPLAGEEGAWTRVGTVERA